jgi:hypothetical protein
MRRTSAYPVALGAARRNRILASSAVVGYWVSCWPGRSPAPSLPYLNWVSGSNARYLRVVSLAAMLFAGVIIAQIIVPL